MLITCQSPEEALCIGSKSWQVRQERQRMIRVRVRYDLHITSIWEAGKPARFGLKRKFLCSTSTDLFLPLALAMPFFTPCSAILTQSYGKSIRQFWLMFA
jgi:hypothetical protein